MFRPQVLCYREYVIYSVLYFMLPVYVGGRSFRGYFYSLAQVSFFLLMFDFFFFFFWGEIWPLASSGT